MTSPFGDLLQPTAADVLVTQVVSEALQCPVHSVVPILGYGQINAVFRVDTTIAPLIVRLNQFDHLATYRKEQWCLQPAHQHGIPVPTVLAVGTAADNAFMIQAYLPGTSGAAAGVDAGQIWRDRGIIREHVGNRKGARSDYEHAADLYRQIGDTAKYQDMQKRLEALQP